MRKQKEYKIGTTFFFLSLSLSFSPIVTAETVSSVLEGEREKLIFCSVFPFFFKLSSLLLLSESFVFV